MATDLVLRAEFQQIFPGLAAGLREAQRVFKTVKSFEDIERIFLKGVGLAANTYRVYLSAVRQFYEWSHGKHPLQTTASDIEGFYDELVKRVARATAYNRIQGLKRFFAGVQTVVPIFSSPFKTMGGEVTPQAEPLPEEEEDKGRAHEVRGPGALGVAQIR
jgi:hypothetical protein